MVKLQWALNPHPRFGSLMGAMGRLWSLDNHCLPLE